MTASRHFVIMDNEVREAVVKEMRDLWHTQLPSIIMPNHKPMITYINSDLDKVKELIEKRLNQLNYDFTDEAMVNDKTIGAYLELLEFMEDLKQNH